VADHPAPATGHGSRPVAGPVRSGCPVSRRHPARRPPAHHHRDPVRAITRSESGPPSPGAIDGRRRVSAGSASARHPCPGAPDQDLDR